MKSVYLPGNKEVVVRDVDPPRPGHAEVRIAVKASCICRSDMSLYYGNAVLLSHTGYPWACTAAISPSDAENCACTLWRD